MGRHPAADFMISTEHRLFSCKLWPLNHLPCTASRRRVPQQYWPWIRLAVTTARSSPTSSWQMQDCFYRQMFITVCTLSYLFLPGCVLNELRLTRSVAILPQILRELSPSLCQPPAGFSAPNIHPLTLWRQAAFACVTAAAAAAVALCCNTLSD